jgi:carboxynorspermidine decarboxylase
MGQWSFDRGDLKIGDRVVFEDMIHYTMVKTTMFNGVRHPSIAILHEDGRLQIVKEFTYEDYKTRMS